MCVDYWLRCYREAEDLDRIRGTSPFVRDKRRGDLSISVVMVVVQEQDASLLRRGLGGFIYYTVVPTLNYLLRSCDRYLIYQHQRPHCPPCPPTVPSLPSIKPAHVPRQCLHRHIAFSLTPQ